MRIQRRAFETSSIVTVPCQLGLTLQVAARVVAIARRFESDITFSSEKLVADAKSIVSILLLGATRGKVLVLTARGKDADEAAQILSHLFETKEVLCEEDQTSTSERKP